MLEEIWTLLSAPSRLQATVWLRNWAFTVIEITETWADLLLIPFQKHIHVDLSVKFMLLLLNKRLES